MTIRSRWRLVANRIQLVELLAGGNHGDAAARVLHQHCNLLAGKGGIDGHIDRADGQRGEIGHRPLPAVLADQRNAIALLRAPA